MTSTCRASVSTQRPCALNAKKLLITPINWCRRFAPTWPKRLSVQASPFSAAMVVLRGHSGLVCGNPVASIVSLPLRTWSWPRALIPSYHLVSKPMVGRCSQVTKPSTLSGYRVGLPSSAVGISAWNLPMFIRPLAVKSRWSRPSIVWCQHLIQILRRLPAAT